MPQNIVDTFTQSTDGHFAMIPLTKGKYVLVDEADAEWIRSFGRWHATKGSKSQTYYAARNGPKVGGCRSPALLMHNIIAGHKGIDHVNRNGLDNRRTNLRPATDRQNNANIGLRSNNTSGYKGVVWRKPGRHRTGEVGRWWARISVEGKVRSLGLFDDPVEAACAYNRAALEAFGEFAWLNPVPDEVAVRMAAAAEIKSRPKAKPQSKSRPSPAANRTALVASRAKPAANRRIINSMETSKLPAPKVSDRISIALIPKAVAGLAALQERTGLSKTDAVNRAISLYEFIDTQLRAGRDLLVRDPETGKTQLVHLL